jgi:GTP-binding protein HflX
LARLVDTLGYIVVGTLSQKRPSTGGATVVGKGKLRELAHHTGGPGEVVSAVQVKLTKAAEKFAKNEVEEESEEEEAEGTGEVEEDVESDTISTPPLKPDVVIFDCDLTPSQLRNLESATGKKALDRSGVIIEIFSRHARTRAARLQVEIARLNYLAPRMRETGSGADRQGGGIGGKGAGESSQELDRRRIRDRVKELKQEIEEVHRDNAVRRTRRQGENRVALVGYTNAGKSSLMRAMTGSEVYVADKLFATLETTVRPLVPESVPRVLLSDTVGFIKKLPHDLVASFRSTLDEANEADLLFFVVDSSDPTFRDQLEVTRSVLSEIGATETPSKLVLNKRDLLTPEQAEALAKEYPEAVMISTRDKNDLASLRETLIRFFEADMVEEELFVPYSAGSMIGEIRARLRVLTESYDGAGTKLRVRGKPEDVKRITSRLLKSSREE